MPMKLAWTGVNHITGRDPDDFAVFGSHLTNSRHDVENLAFGMGVPVGSRSGLEHDRDRVEYPVLAL